MSKSVVSLEKSVYLSNSSDYYPCPEALGYTIGKTLGGGRFSQVKAAWSPFEGEMIAMKVVYKEKVPPEHWAKFIIRELDLLQVISHPNIIELLQIVETDKHCFMALEMAENGDLLSYLNSRGRLPEEEARFIFNQICQGFHFALSLTNHLSDTPCGSYSYAAPEVSLSNGEKYDTRKADCWSLGVIVYAMASDSFPFGTKQQIARSLSEYEGLHFNSNFSIDLIDLVQSLLSLDPTGRPQVRDILHHKWTSAEPKVRPAWVDPTTCKYTIERCLPSYLHQVKSRKSMTSCSNTTNSVVMPYPMQFSSTFSKHSSLLIPAAPSSQIDLQPEVVGPSADEIPQREIVRFQAANSPQQMFPQRNSKLSARIKAAAKKLGRYFKKLKWRRN